MDWVRSCYQSSWALWKNDPTLTVRGRYYFTPANAPWVEAFTPFTSANYRRGDPGASGDLGERLDAARSWDPGTPPALLPDLLTSGDVADLETGCNGTGALPPGWQVVDGFDSRCFTNIPAPTLGTWDDLDPNNPAVLLLLAQLLEWSYTDPTQAVGFFSFWLGAGVNVHVVPNTASLYPGSIIVQHPRFTIVVISGTSNPQQLALQALYSTVGPIDVGPFSTSPLLLTAAGVIVDRMTAVGIDPTLPILVTGHSYGGAVGQVLTAMFRRANTARPLRLVTFGSPAAGDYRLHRALRNVPQWHFTTLNDPVPQLPLQGPNLYGLQALLPSPLLTAWLRWSSPSPYRLIDTDPGLPAAQFGNLPFTILRSIALAFAAGRPQLPFPQHAITAYLLLLRALNPGVDPWPIPAPVKALLVSSPTWTIEDVGRLSVWGNN